MTLTQEHQPYGPLTRGEFTIDGVTYTVRRLDREFCPFANRFRWVAEHWVPTWGKGGGTVRDAFSDLPEASTLRDAAEVLLGVAS